MDNQKQPSREGYIIVRDDQLDEEGMSNLIAFIKLLMRWDAELAAKGQSPIQHIHDKHAREIAEKEGEAILSKPKLRRRRKSRPLV